MAVAVADRAALTSSNKVTCETLRAMKRRNEPAVLVTAYDYPTAVFADRAGVDALLVGDSAAMTMMGLPATTAIGMTEMMVFVRSVCRGAGHAFVIGDLPFLSYQPSNELAILNAGAFIGAGCDAVKCEGGLRVAARVRAMTDAGIAVMGHLGLTPQSLGQLGGYRVQGKTAEAADRLVEDAVALEEAGAFAVLLEGMPAETAAYVREQVSIIVYGIGAGPGVDGQLLISHDLLGSFVGNVRPRFVQRYADVGSVIETAFQSYAADVRLRHFPSPAHCYAAGESLLSTLCSSTLSRPQAASGGAGLPGEPPDRPRSVERHSPRSSARTPLVSGRSRRAAPVRHPVGGTSPLDSR
jgi:3-methyl-2-oxobutanoate hydroxymethyltransferase